MQCSKFISLITVIILISSTNCLAKDLSIQDIGDVRASLLLTALESKDSIYKNLSECLNDAPGAIEMNQCYEKSYKDYDALLNKAYHLAMSSLNADSQTALRSSQKKWLAFRDEESKLYGKNWGYNPGSIIGTAIVIHKISMIRERIAELSMYAHFDEQ